MRLYCRWFHRKHWEVYYVHYWPNKQRYCYKCQTWVDYGWIR